MHFHLHNQPTNNQIKLKNRKSKACKPLPLAVSLPVGFASCLALSFALFATAFRAFAAALMKNKEYKNEKKKKKTEMAEIEEDNKINKDENNS